MGFMRKIGFYTVILLIVPAFLVSFSTMLIASPGDEPNSRFIDHNVKSKIVSDMTRAVDQVQADGNVALFFASVIELQNSALDKAIESTATQSRIADLAASIVYKQSLEAKNFRDRKEKGSFQPLPPAASQAFGRLMGDVLISFEEDLAESRAASTAEEDFIRFLVAYHFVVVDMSKVFLIFEDDPSLRSIVLRVLARQETDLKTIRETQAVLRS